MNYIVFVCKKCGRAQGTTSQTKGKCKVCNSSNTLKTPTKILLYTTNLSEITKTIKEYNANKENIYFDYQKEIK